MLLTKPLPDNVFRASVGAVIINGTGKVLAFERSDNSGSWQFPQGGMDENEEPFAAVLREVEEETNLGRDRLELLMEYPKLNTNLRLDLLIEDKVIVELKAKEAITPIDKQQLLSYLRLSGKRLGLIINFNVKLLRDGVYRIVNRL